MKQMQFNEGYRALMRFGELELPIRSSFQISLLAKQLRPAIEAETEMEKKILEKHKATISPNGTITIGDDTMSDEEILKLRIGFQKDWNELLNAENAMEFEPVHVLLSDVENQHMSASVLGKLEGFVIFD